jgi:hypothetical protein
LLQPAIKNKPVMENANDQSENTNDNSRNANDKSQDTNDKSQDFRRFAEEKLRNHTEELKTRYRNEALGSKELKEESYIGHQRIFNQEMDEKINQLIPDDDPWLKEELKNLKDNFLLKLSPDVSV